MKKVTIDGNSACAHIAYLMNDLAIIYPITPSSTMSELCDNMRANNNLNVFGNKLNVVEMQSEAGVAGALHGALSAGSLTTTFTSSQGLLLMLPNMYKIAGEFLPTVFFVASRSLATHALNIFCDHSDIYSCLKTGFNIISCSSVQEVNDMAIACNLASLKSSTPFICFFDGFRTSHELNTIEQTEMHELKKIIDFDDIKKFKAKSMSPNAPFAKGTNQNPDVFFQNRVASLSVYKNVVDIVKNSFENVYSITNRKYDTIEYYGDKNAQDIVISMGSSVDSLLEAIKLRPKTAVMKIRLLKPFDEKTFISKLPKNIKNITVLERNLDVNGVDSLYSFITTALFKNKIKCNLYTGTYGLGGKEFTPDMAISVFDNMRGRKKDNFTVGIYDNVNYTNLEIKPFYKDDTNFAIRIYGYGSDGSVSSAKNIIKILADKNDVYAQGYFDYDSKKSGSLTVSHIRTSLNPINKPYNSTHVNISICNNTSYLTKYDMTSCIRENGIFLINSGYNHADLDDILPDRMKLDIQNKNISVYTIDANKIAKEFKLNGKINTIMQTALFKITNQISYKTALTKIKKSIIDSYSKKGEDVVNANLNAIEAVAENIKKVNTKLLRYTPNPCSNIPQNEFYENIIRPINNQEGNDIPVSKFSLDGRMPTNTSKLEKRGIATQLPEWLPKECIQCGRCVMMCPHACLRPVEFKEQATPKNFKSAKSFSSENNYRIQLSPLDCTGCGVCSDVCPARNKAIKMNDSLNYREQEISNYEFLKELKIEQTKTNYSCKGIQFLKPYFEFSGACAGCGETPYIKLVSQLFGDRMLIANATGCSSIYGGTYPSCPYSQDKYGFGPAWANSLFEDNAEFGYGIALSKRIERENFIKLLKKNKNSYSHSIKEIVTLFLEDTDNHAQNKELISRLNFYRYTHLIDESDKEVFDNINLFVKPSTWIIGGDGWAYDIGFGGLDHVVSTGENVNILILDTEVYSNTGGQTSKSTPRGATAKFNVSGKTTAKKDILSMLMTYKDVYVAKVSMGANPDQCVKAFTEAENYDGPSVILAYAPCINHGYNMSKSQTHCADAVKSGYWSLFRYNPNLEPQMQIDSYEPIKNYEDFTESETRYKILSKTNPEEKEVLIEKSKQDAINLIERYKNKSKN